MNGRNEGIIFNIQKFSIHDGPGIRTTVFLKGCPLHCWWCHNPESINPELEIAFSKSKCINCGKCFEVCPTGAISKGCKERIYRKDRCILCGKCAEICYAGAIIIYGRKITVDEVMKEVEKDIPFYRNSGGGITISGGEPLMQKEFVKEIFKKCKEENISTALDTSLYGTWDKIKDIFKYLDIILVDIKHMSSEKHKKYTGVGNELILENIKKIPDEVLQIIRVPIVPSFNDDEENIRRTADFVKRLNKVKVEVLPYHRLGTSKYEAIGKKEKVKNLKIISKDKLDEIKKMLERGNGD